MNNKQLTENFFDYFIPESLLESTSAVMRCKIFLGVLLVNIIFGFVAIFMIGVVLNLGEGITRLGLTIMIVVLSGYSITLVLLKITANYFIATNFFILTMTVTILPPIFLTGGYHFSPVVSMAAVIPVAAFLLSGMKGGAVWSVIVTVICIGMYLAAHFESPYIVQLVEVESALKVMKLGLQLVLLGMVVLALVVYELMNETLIERLNEERDNFEHKASHDALTGIPNRFEFFRRLKQCLKECEHRDHKLAVVYLDLDGFKPINDEYGHPVGDEVLKVIASRLQNVLRFSDTTARLGGDEFSLILSGIKRREDIDPVISKALEVIRQPITVDACKVSVSGSAGIAIFPDSTAIADDLCKFADAALYKAKEQHNAYVYYETDMHDSEDLAPA